MKARTLVAALVLGLAGMAPAAPARADATPAELAKAREEFRRAVSLEEAKDYRGALTVFKQVALVRSSPQVRYHIAFCEEKSGDLVQALGSYKLAALEAQNTKGAGDVEKASNEGAASVEPRIPTLTLKRGDGAAGAKVTLDGRELNAVATLDLPVNPGLHVLEATAAGRKPFKKELTLAESSKQSVEVVLEVEVTVPTATAEPTVTAAPTVVPTAETPPGMSPVRAAGFAVAGLGVVGLALGGAFFGLRGDAIAKLDKECGADRLTCPDSLKGLESDGQLYSTLAPALLIGGGVVAAGGLAMIIFAPKKSAQPANVQGEVRVGARGTAAGATLVFRY